MPGLLPDAHAALAGVLRRLSAGEEEDVRERDNRDEGDADPAADASGHNREADGDEPQSDERLHPECLVPRAYTRGDDRTHAEHRGEVERV